MLVVLTVKERESECASMSVQEVRVLRMNVLSLSWRRRQHVLPHRYYLCTKLHGEFNSYRFGICLLRTRRNSAIPIKVRDILC